MNYTLSEKFKNWADIIIQDAQNLKNNNSIWGIAPLFPLHLGFEPLINLQRELLNSGCNHTIIIFDTAFFLSGKQIENSYYKKIINYYIEILSLLGLKRSDFVIASQYQYREYFWDIVCKLSRQITRREMLKAGPSYFQESDPLLSDLLHIIFQISDIVFHNASIVVGDTGQKKVYDEGRKILRKSGFIPPAELLVELPLDIKGNRLTVSNSLTRISYHESENSLKRKIDSMQFENKEVVCDLFKNSVFFHKNTINFKGENLNWKNFLLLFNDIDNKQFDELKECLCDILNERLSGVREYFKENPDLADWINFKKIRGS